MNRTITTSLGDIWTIEDDIVTSNNSKRWYGLSHDLEKMLHQSTENNAFANSLRKIDIAPLSKNGKSFLLEDRFNPGWSRAVEFDHPDLFWVEFDFYNGETLINTKDNNIRLVTHICEIGNSIDMFELCRYDDKSALTGSYGFFKSKTDALNFLKADNLPEPLPPANDLDTIIVPIQNNMHAEVLFYTQSYDDYWSHYLKVAVLDSNNNLLLMLDHTNPQTIIELRDNAAFVQQMLDEGNRIHAPDYKAFKAASSVVPESLEALSEAISKLKDGERLKLKSNDSSTELVVQWKPMCSLRTIEGRRIFLGEEMLPRPSILDDYKIDRLYMGQERAYSLSIKKTNGAIVSFTPPMTIDHEKLFDYTSNTESLNSHIEEAKARSPALNRLTALEAIAASMQGSFDKVEYITKKEVATSEMARRIANQYRRAEEKFLALG